jgi:hypothetical protein
MQMADQKEKQTIHETHCPLNKVLVKIFTWKDVGARHQGQTMSNIVL